jgi:shikimate dehydrogenase
MSAAITPETALCGIVLHPAGHTRSPAIHNAAYARLGIDAIYLAFDVPPSEFGSAIAGMRALRMRQLAVSIPHKVAVMELVDEVEETARAIGAVNTVTREGDRLIGSNSDWLGVTAALAREATEGLAGARAVVLGAGGAARAAVYGLLDAGASVTLLNRTESKAVALADELGAEASGPLDAFADLPDWDLLVNATSVGLKEDRSPVRADALRKDSIVLDAVYDPANTRLLRDAAARGARGIAGKWWLVHQAAVQLERWSGSEAPVEVMAEAFDSCDGART